MRNDSIRFAQSDRARRRSPRYIVAIIFPTASVYCTSHGDIANVPGVVINDVLREPSAISQRLVPDEGRAEIGSFSFSLIDRDGEFTDAIRTHLVDDEGIRGREVRFFIGYEGFDFSEFVRFTTQIVVSDSVKDGVYDVDCRDITRQQNKEIFKPVATTLRLSCGATDTTINVGSTTKFLAVAHGVWYSDAPGQTVGYCRLEDEIFRWPLSGKTSNSFTNVTRGVLNTVAKAHSISENTSEDKQPKIEEFIYLEGPGPYLAYAINTGVLYGTANTLPAHWHLGISTSWIRVNDFIQIGYDLWFPGLESNALNLRFEGLKAQDGKRFLEREIYLLLACFSPVYSDGTLGLRRMSPLISTAAPSFILNESNITELGALMHDGEGMHNQFRILWAWDAIIEDYVRESRFIDAASIEIHGDSTLQTYEFRGLHGSRHTDVTIAQRLAAIRDRYASPPKRKRLTVFGSLNRIEIGDVGQVRLSEETLRDYTANAGDFRSSFEVHQQTYNAANGEVVLELFGSTSRPQAQPPLESNVNALPDSWYGSEGVALSSVTTIVGNVMQAGTYTLTGASSMTAAAASFYVLGDLTIADGVTLNITGNVHLKIRGFLQINGDIVGTGGGQAGVTDGGGAITGPIAGNAGYLGNSRAWDGIKFVSQARGVGTFRTIPAAVTRGLVDAVPVYEISALNGTLTGIPADMRGTGGPPGGRVVDINDTVSAVGGSGANGGAGLLITCRGIAFGSSGSIVLDGADAVTPASVTVLSRTLYPGTGGGGSPGAMLILLDGSSISFPVIANKFFSRGGTVSVVANPLSAPEARYGQAESVTPGLVGYADPTVAGLSNFDYSNVAYGIQYIAEPVNPEADQNARPPAPTGLSASSAAGGNLLVWTSPPEDQYAVIEIYASIDNDRANALFVGEIKGNSFMHSLPLGGLRYYWIRAARTYNDGRAPVRSTFEPVGTTSGIVSNAETPGEGTDSPSQLWATGLTNGIRFSWALPAVGRLVGKVELFENTAPAPFESATKVWEGYGFSYFLRKSDTTIRYYWVRLYRGSTLSVIEPDGNGIPGAAISIASEVVATASPKDLVTRSTAPIISVSTMTSSSTTVSVSGGVPPYSYSWAFVAGGTGIWINSPSLATTTFTATSSYGSSRTGTARSTVTDSTGATAYADVTLKFIFASPIF